MAATNSTPDIELRMLSQPRLLTACRAMVSNLAQRLGFSDMHAGQVSLAVDEALCNVINHGYQRVPHGLIEVRIWAIDGSARAPEVVLALEERVETTPPPMAIGQIRNCHKLFNSGWSYL